jgi:hypothetical protein
LDSQNSPREKIFFIVEFEPVAHRRHLLKFSFDAQVAKHNIGGTIKLEHYPVFR